MEGVLILEIKLFDSEIKVMNVIWENGDMTASKIADILKENIGWNKNTTYTLIKRCITKGAIERYEPKFMCRPLVSKEMIQKEETKELIDKVFDGSADLLFSSLLSSKGLKTEEINKLKNLIDEMS